MNIGSENEARNAVVEEMKCLIGDARDYLGRQVEFLDAMDRFEQVALLRVADMEGRVSEAEQRLAAERAELVEAQLELERVYTWRARFREEHANGVRELERAEREVTRAAEKLGYQYNAPLLRVVFPLRENAR